MYYQAIRTKKCRVSNFEVNFPKIRFLVIEQNASQATICVFNGIPLLYYMLENFVYKHSSRDLSDNDVYAIHRRLLHEPIQRLREEWTTPI